ncbi:MAG: hypothetical protein GY871_04355 [Actinomycetales bacterium]|nr:hypothetical protein [Actinomycetales bacterium]
MDESTHQRLADKIRAHYANRENITAPWNYEGMVFEMMADAPSEDFDFLLDLSTSLGAYIKSAMQAGLFEFTLHLRGAGADLPERVRGLLALSAQSPVVRTCIDENGDILAEWGPVDLRAPVMQDRVI